MASGNNLKTWSDFGKWVTESTWLSGLKLRLGAANVFDEAPSYSESSLVGVDGSQADTRQRFVYGALTKRF